MAIHLVWKILYWSWVAVELYVLFGTRVRRKDRSSEDNHDRGSLIVLWVTIFSSIFAASWISAVYRPTSFAGGRWLPALALGLLAAGLAIRVTAIFTLGKAFTANVNVHASQTVKQDGLFRHMRHPSYTGMVLIFVALGIAMHNWLALVLVTIPPVIALLYRIHVEEAALAGAFGAEYSDYCARTSRLIPGIY